MISPASVHLKLYTIMHKCLMAATLLESIINPCPASHNNCCLISHLRMYFGSLYNFANNIIHIRSSLIRGFIAFGSKTHLSKLSTDSTQEDPSLFNGKIVDGT